MAEVAASAHPPKRTGDEEELDPRVKEELDILNSTAEEINKLEIELDHARTKFRSLLTEATQRLNVLYKKLGRCVNKARPYYDLLKESKRAQGEAQRAVVKFHRANGIYRAAKETVALAEERLMSMGDNGEKREFDAAWQEMLNHATMKFMDSEKDKTLSEQEHSRRASEVVEMQKKCKALEKSMPRTIPRSRAYFELKERLEFQLQQEKLNVEDLVRALQLAKTRYRSALAALEAISEEVHMKRRMMTVLPPRTPGVGAENFNDTSDLPSINLDLRRNLSSDPGGDVISINSDDFDVISTDGSEVGDDSPRLEPRSISLPVSPLARDTASSCFQRGRGRDGHGDPEESTSTTSPPQMDPLGIAYHCQKMTPHLMGNGRKYSAHLIGNGNNGHVANSCPSSASVREDPSGSGGHTGQEDSLGGDGAGSATGGTDIANNIRQGNEPDPTTLTTSPTQALAPPTQSSPPSTLLTAPIRQQTSAPRELGIPSPTQVTKPPPHPIMPPSNKVVNSADIPETARADGVTTVQNGLEWSPEEDTPLLCSSDSSELLGGKLKAIPTNSTDS